MCLCYWPGTLGLNVFTNLAMRLQIQSGWCVSSAGSRTNNLHCKQTCNQLQDMIHNPIPKQNDVCPMYPRTLTMKPK